MTLSQKLSNYKIKLSQKIFEPFICELDIRLSVFGADLRARLFPCRNLDGNNLINFHQNTLNCGDFVRKTLMRIPYVDVPRRAKRAGKFSECFPLKYKEFHENTAREAWRRIFQADFL